MFTGIVEEKGTVRRIIHGQEWGSIVIAANRILEGTKRGDSIAVNGVCLTVTTLGSKEFTADVMAETLRRTNLGELKWGEQVNLERAAAVGDRLGGHIVSGHIDGTGKICSMRREGNAVWIAITAAESVRELIIEKGSVAVDGISLTVAAVSDREKSFSVSVIPHTASGTTLLSKKTGETVNLENDVVGKYVKKLINGQSCFRHIKDIVETGDKDRVASFSESPRCQGSGREQSGIREQGGAGSHGKITEAYLIENGF